MMGKEPATVYFSEVELSRLLMLIDDYPKSKLDQELRYKLQKAGENKFRW